MEIDDENDDHMEIDEVNWPIDEKGARHVTEWTRNDYGTSRLMMPGANGPLWSSCVDRATVHLNANQVTEHRDVNLIVGREMRREFRGGARNVLTTFVYKAEGPFNLTTGNAVHADIEDG